VFGFFVLGLAAGRSVIVAAIPAHRPLLRRVATWGLVIGLPANLLFAAGRLTTDPVAWGLLPLAESVGILAMTLGYAAGFALVWDRHRPWLAEQLQPLGRMALTCYLTQTLICQYGLSGLGLGWFLEVGAATATALVVPVLVLQWGFARWWLGRYRFGPVEWAWRSLTYGRAQPMRR
jgi:uncharacterized protein